MQVFIMPLSEFLRMASRKSGSSQLDNDIVELLWENGQITTQGQSSRAARTSPLNTFPSNTNKTRTGKLSRFDSVPHDMSHVVVPQPDNNMVPWFDSLTHDCGSVFLPEIPSVVTQRNATESAKGVPCRERIVEPVVASSSIGSGNSADRVYFEQTHNSKRKYRDIEDSEGRSEDVGTESVGVEKTTVLAGGKGGSKRGRAAEVHNLSERRRRDRINEKMRALQELIPNSNKSDKASMLEEAIEYLKTLQAQVQMLSMGAGLCMPQMMFQHMHPAASHIPHFSPMGMLDIPRFSASLPTNIQGIPSPNLPVYGHPIQGLPMIRQPSHMNSGQPSHTNSASVLSGLRNRSHNAVNSTSPVSNSGDF